MTIPRPFSPVVSNERLKYTVFAVVVIAIGIAAWYSHFPYLDCGFAFDDYDFQQSIGQIQTGKDSWGPFLVSRWGPRLMPLWKLTYSAAILVSGCSPYGMHLFVLGLHAVSALFLYVLLRRLNLHPLSAAAGSLLWAGASVGSVDSPGIWPFTGYATLSLIVLLALLILLTNGSDRQRWPYYLLVALTTLALILVDSPNLVFVAFLFLSVALWFRGPQASAVRRRLLGSIGIPLILTAPVAVVFALSAVGDRDRQREFDLLGVFERTVAQISFSLGTLVYSRTNMPNDALPGKYALATAVLVVAAVTVNGKRRTFFWALLAVTFAHVLSFNLGGVNVKFSSAVNSGRYLYFPTFFWCVVAALLLARLLDESPRRRVAVVLVSFLALSPFYLGHQRAVAERSTYFYDLEAGPCWQAYQLQRAFLIRLAKQAQVERKVLSLADMPVRVPNSRSLLWTASAFTATCVPEIMPYLAFRKFSPEDNGYEKQLALVEACEDPIRPTGWKETLVAAEELREQFEWLIRLGRARSVSITFPDVPSNLAGIRVWTSSFLDFYDLLGPDEVQVVKGKPAGLKSVESMLRLVQSTDEPQAKVWQKQLQILLPAFRP